MRLITFAFILLSATEVHSKCIKLCDVDWWEKASSTQVIDAIKSGEDVNGQGVNGQGEGFFPLHLAAWKSTASNVKILLMYGANVEAVAFASENSWRPLHTAAMMGTVETVRALISAGADVSAKDKIDFTPLHWAGLREKSDLINVLIDAGADINDLKYE